MKTTHRHASMGHFIKLATCDLEMTIGVILLNKEISIGNLNTFWRFRVEEAYFFNSRTK